MAKTRSKRKREKGLEQNPSPISKPSFADLPQDIIQDLLICLPVKTLIGFRCVCKSWLNLISNPNFIETHLEKSSISNNYTHHSLILNCIANGYHSLTSFSFRYLLSGLCNAIDVDYLSINPYCGVSIVGSCNGLVCIAITKVGWCFWNPSTKISKKVPVSDSNFRLNLLAHYGFGYDILNDDYKLVWILPISKALNDDEAEVNIYSLKTNSWTKIGDFPHGWPFHDGGKYVNGVLHWTVADKSAFNSSKVIVSLDLGKETYGEIGQPCYGDLEFTGLKLGVLKGCLSVFSHFDKKSCDIWVMKEYGVRDTWIKLYTIPYGLEVYIDCYHPCCIIISGEILEFRPCLFLYNPINGRFRKLKIRNLHNSLRCLDATTYVESLVSPHIAD